MNEPLTDEQIERVRAFPELIRNAAKMCAKVAGHIIPEHTQGYVQACEQIADELEELLK